MNKTASAQHLILLRKISLYTFVLVLLWIVPTVFSAGAESKYLSVRELRESTPAEWKETLIGGKKKFECTVDAPIVLPEVDRFPILRVACQGELPGLEESGYYIENNDGRKAYRMKQWKLWILWTKSVFTKNPWMRKPSNMQKEKPGVSFRKFGI